MKPALDYQIGSVVGDFFLVCEWGMVGSLFSLLPPLLLPPPPCFGSWILNFCCHRGNATTQKFFQTHTLPTTKGSFLHVGTTTTFISFFCKRGKVPPNPTSPTLAFTFWIRMGQVAYSFLFFFLSLVLATRALFSDKNVIYLYLPDLYLFKENCIFWYSIRLCFFYFIIGETRTDV